MNRLQVGFAVTVFIGIIWAATGLLTLSLESGWSDFLTGLAIICVGVIGVELMHQLIADRDRLRAGRDQVWRRREAGL
jgi:hypothetical protein